MADDVKDLGAEREKRKKKKNGEGSDQVQLFRAICGAIDHMPWSTLPPFPGRFFLVKCNQGTYLVKADPDDDAIVAMANKDDLEAAIAIYTRDTLGAFEGYRFSPRAIKECARYWWLTAEKSGEPRPFLWPREEGRGFSRLPWDKAPGPCPTWDALLKKILNSKAFCHFVGSMFVDDSDRQQYLWLWGDGGDGKGAITRILSRLFGSACYSGQPPAPGREMFWGYYALTGKRLVVFPDCNAASFVTGGFFKSLTGDDPVAVEIKGGAIFTFRPNAKYMFHSNLKPKISSQKADIRRIILCSFKADDSLRVEGTAQEFESRLWGECGAFVYRCITEYCEAHPSRGVIANDDEGKDLVDTLAASHDEDFEIALERSLFVSPAAEMRPSDFQDIVKAHFKERQRGLDFVDWLLRVHGVVKIATKLPNGKVVRIYKGIQLKAQENTPPPSC